MSEATTELKAKVIEYREAMDALSEARSQRNAARYDLRELELDILNDKTTDGTIDGRNAETREAQLHVQYKLNAKWGASSSLARNSEGNYQKALDRSNVLLIELRVIATLVNAEIAETGNTRLLANVDLAGV